MTDFLLFLGKVLIAGSVGESLQKTYIFVLVTSNRFSLRLLREFILSLTEISQRYKYLMKRICGYLQCCLCVSGVIAFFFFTHKMPIFQEEVPTLHYYWVPLLVRGPNRKGIAVGISYIQLGIDGILSCLLIGRR